MAAYVCQVFYYFTSMVNSKLLSEVITNSNFAVVTRCFFLPSCPKLGWWILEISTLVLCVFTPICTPAVGKWSRSWLLEVRCVGPSLTTTNQLSHSAALSRPRPFLAKWNTVISSIKYKIKDKDFHFSAKIFRARCLGIWKIPKIVKEHDHTGNQIEKLRPVGLLKLENSDQIF